MTDYNVRSMLNFIYLIIPLLIIAYIYCKPKWRTYYLLALSYLSLLSFFSSYLLIVSLDACNTCMELSLIIFLSSFYFSLLRICAVNEENKKRHVFLFIFLIVSIVVSFLLLMMIFDFVAS